MATHVYDPQDSATIAVTTVTGTCATPGANTIVAAPAAGYRLKLHNIQVQLENATETLVLVKSGSTTIRRVLAVTKLDGIIKEWPPGREYRLGTAEALILNLSAAGTIGYTVEYETEKV